jgi:DNA-binding ferritin-like protein
LPPSLQCKASREPLYQAVQDVIDLTTERMRAGGNDPKGHLFLTAAAAQIQAMTNGIPPEDVVPEAVKQSALHCLEILRARTKLPPSELGEKYTPESNVSAEINSMEETDFGLWMLDGNMDFNLPQPWVLSGWEMA